MSKLLGVDRPTDKFNPQHYRNNPQGIESVDVIEAFFSKDAHLSQAFKYMARAGKKRRAPYTEDVQKALWWLQRAIEYRRKQNEGEGDQT